MLGNAHSGAIGASLTQAELSRCRCILLMFSLTRHSCRSGCDHPAEISPPTVACHLAVLRIPKVIDTSSQSYFRCPTRIARPFWLSSNLLNQSGARCVRIRTYGLTEITDCFADYQALPINTPGPAAEVILAKPSSGRQLRIGMRITEGIGAVSSLIQSLLASDITLVSAFSRRGYLSPIHFPQRHFLRASVAATGRHR